MCAIPNNTTPSFRSAVIIFCLSAAPLLLIFGLTADPAPKPLGVLLDGTVVDHAPPGPGDANAAIVSVQTPEGRVICGVERVLLPNGRLPVVGATITVDYADGRCRPAAEDNTGIRVGLVLIGATGVIGVSTYYWRRSGPGRRFRAARKAATRPDRKRGAVRPSRGG
ncbi:hypothetical protein I0C86_07580 [Plantactinospora sp. S1510]|uniref:Transmembrane protein n=1 Tax=Plantactinospora alkalitolerans TaxID=2789879 RepID=A0ABS0GRN2_9ACTN|nr:hypothetical protein [Plantactinospora alkalitolerans]MBF9128845.1 hypothetical protein [Plantactinospora alkalitolerans]